MFPLHFVFAKFVYGITLGISHTEFADASRCSRASIRVPGDVDLVGVENEEIIATMSTPPLGSVRLGSVRLGSVRLGSDQIGYEAVRFLDRMIRRLKPLEPALLRRSRYWKCSVKRLASRPAITAAVFIPASDESRPARPRR